MNLKSMFRAKVMRKKRWFRLVLRKRHRVETRFPQPFVQTPQGLRLLDDVAGAGWRLVVRDPCPDAEALARANGMRVLGFSANAADGYTEAEGVLAAWFARAGVCAALVRPDHYVYGVADTPAAATALVRRLIDARQGNS